jgi:hypothetical protein
VTSDPADARTRRLRALREHWLAERDALHAAAVKESDLMVQMAWNGQALARQDCADELEAVLDTEGDRPAQLPCGCYIAQCPTHRSQVEGDARPAPQLCRCGHYETDHIYGRGKRCVQYLCGCLYFTLPDPPVQP